MKLPKIFIVLSYLHIFFLFRTINSAIDEINNEKAGNMGVFFSIFLIISFVLIIVASVNVYNAVLLYKKGNYKALKKSMVMVKIWTIPFYIANFIFSFFVCVCFAMGLMGVGIFFVPIPIMYTCSIIFMTGFYGIFYVKFFKKNFQLEKPLSLIHYFLQLIPVLDTIDTFFLLFKLKNVKVAPTPDEETLQEL